MNKKRLLMVMGKSKKFQSPLEISGLKLWLDFSDPTTLYTDNLTTNVTADSDKIYSVADKSGNTQTALQETEAKRPLYKTNIQNGKSSALFDGSNYWLSVNSVSSFNFLHNSESSIYFVGKIGTVADPNVIYIIIDNNTTAASVGFSLYYDDRASASRNNAYRVMATRAVTDYVFAQVLLDTITPNTFSLLEHIGDATNATAGDRSIATVNSGAENKTSTSSGVAVASDAGYTFHIGIMGNEGSGEFAGYMSEILIYDSCLSSKDRTNVKQYLTTKWGL